MVVCDDVRLCKLYDCFQLRAVYVYMSIDCSCVHVVAAGTCTYTITFTMVLDFEGKLANNIFRPL